MTARHEKAVAGHTCPRPDCEAEPGVPCVDQRSLPVMAAYRAAGLSFEPERTKVPHPERVALVPRLPPGRERSRPPRAGQGTRLGYAWGR